MVCIYVKYRMDPQIVASKRCTRTHSPQALTPALPLVDPTQAKPA